MPTNHTMMSARSNPQQFYDRLLASVEGIFWQADAQTVQFTYVSEQAERLLGYPLAEWTTPDFWLNHIHLDDRTWAVTFCQRTTHENRNHSFEYRMIAADGRTVWLRDIVSVVTEESTATKVCRFFLHLRPAKADGPTIA